MIRSNLILAIKSLAVDSAVSVLYFPIWWYTLGAVRVASYGVRKLGNAGRGFGVRIWFKNLFRPMFGQYDFAGRIISFFLRLIMIGYYSVVLLVMAVFMAALFALWLALPAFIGYEFVHQVLGILKATKA